MERLLKPDKLDVDTSSPTASLEWKHWLATFQYFVGALPPGRADPKALLVNHVSPTTFSIIAEAPSYEEAIQTLKDMFERPVNEVHERYRLATRRQQPSESIDEFLRALKTLSTECSFKAVSAKQYQEELIRDAFVSGLRSQTIRQRLLDSKTCDLASCLDVARILESAQKSSEAFATPLAHEATVSAAAAGTPESDDADVHEETYADATQQKTVCFFCGLPKHPRSRCPAREATCHKRRKRGHYA
uniref:Retrotransposon gag domain-containing protein n=1 Tax=Trichuris muris TaxID=70415 RepID=A0A5S6QEB4_TRIMR